MAFTTQKLKMSAAADKPRRQLRSSLCPVRRAWHKSGTQPASARHIYHILSQKGVGQKMAKKFVHRAPEARRTYRSILHTRMVGIKTLRMDILKSAPFASGESVISTLSPKSKICSSPDRTQITAGDLFGLCRKKILHLSRISKKLLLQKDSHSENPRSTLYRVRLQKMRSGLTLHTGLEVNSPAKLRFRKNGRNKATLAGRIAPDFLKAYKRRAPIPLSGIWFDGVYRSNIGPNCAA